MKGVAKSLGGVTKEWIARKDGEQGDQKGRGDRKGIRKGGIK
jgi:hypothetical protein